MPINPKALVALATFNELECLPSLVEAIEDSLPTADLLVVDDNSPDGTGKWCEDRTATDSRLSCIHRSGKLGLGSATIEAFRYAIENHYDVVCTMDADWSHEPKVLPQLIAMLEETDVAIGSRYCSGGKIEGWPLSRRVVSRVMNRLTRLLLRVPARDTSGAFRAYRVDTLRSLDLTKISSTGYAYLEEIVWLLDRNGATFSEVPITFRDRQAGESKVSFSELKGKLGMLWRCTMRRSG